MFIVTEYAALMLQYKTCEFQHVCGFYYMRLTWTINSLHAGLFIMIKKYLCIYGILFSWKA